MRYFCYQVFYTFTRNGKTDPSYMWLVATDAKKAVEKCNWEIENISGKAGHLVAIREGCKPETRRRKLQYYYKTYPQIMERVAF